MIRLMGNYLRGQKNPFVEGLAMRNQVFVLLLWPSIDCNSIRSAVNIRNGGISNDAN